MVQIADAPKVMDLAPLGREPDRVDAWVLAKLSHCGLVLTIWLPDPTARRERERARCTLHLCGTSLRCAIGVETLRAAWGLHSVVAEWVDARRAPSPGGPVRCSVWA